MMSIKCKLGGGRAFLALQAHIYQLLTQFASAFVVKDAGTKRSAVTLLRAATAGRAAGKVLGRVLGLKVRVRGGRV